MTSQSADQLQHSPLRPYRLRPSDLARVASVGVRTRRLRSTLSALGIAIGVAAMVAVLGLSSSSQAGLLAEIDQLGTNLLTVANGQTLFGQPAELPVSAAAMIARVGPVEAVSETGTVNVTAYRSPLIPAVQTGGLSVQAARPDLLATAGAAVSQGRFLTEATSHLPVVALGAVAAQRLGIDRVLPGERIWIGQTWFYVTAILAPDALVPALDSDVLVGFPAAARLLGFDGHPSTVYVRADVNQINAVEAVLAATADPEHPEQVQVSRPSDILVARAQAKSALTGLFLALGAVTLLVGGISVANILIIAVLERRSEIGLRRSLGATRGQIRTQFLAEVVLLSATGGMAGLLLGVTVTVIYSLARGWNAVIPPAAWAGAPIIALLVGGLAGLLPAIQAARVSPTEALRSS